MDEEIAVIIPDELDGKRVDAALAELASISRSHLSSLMEEGRVLWGEASVTKPSRKVSAGECYTVRIPPAKEVDLIPQNLPLPIVYQDEDLAVVNKPRGMAVHPSHGIPDGTVVNACLYHLDHLSGINGALRPGIVHRLDKDTTGLLVVAKNDFAHEHLSNQLKERTVKRTYLALCHGVIKEDGEVEAPIGRHPVERKRMAVVQRGGRYARTIYRVAARYPDKTLVQCNLDTGRTHQIRVHMAYIHHPVVGDPLYGIRKDAGKVQMLHAFRLSLIHPRTGEQLSFYAPPGEDFVRAIRSAGGSVEIRNDGIQIGDTVI